MTRSAIRPAFLNTKLTALAEAHSWRMSEPGWALLKKTINEGGYTESEVDSVCKMMMAVEGYTKPADFTAELKSVANSRKRKEFKVFRASDQPAALSPCQQPPPLTIDEVRVWKLIAWLPYRPLTASKAQPLDVTQEEYDLALAAREAGQRIQDALGLIAERDYARIKADQLGSADPSSLHRPIDDSPLMEGEPVVTRTAIPGPKIDAGESGIVRHVYKGNRGYEVEFFDPGGRTKCKATLLPSQITRPLQGGEFRSSEFGSFADSFADF